jgi:hypothetical protein
MRRGSENTTNVDVMLKKKRLQAKTRRQLYRSEVGDGELETRESCKARKKNKRG